MKKHDYLTEDEERKIVALYGKYETADIARRFGVRKAAITRIVRKYKETKCQTDTASPA